MNNRSMCVGVPVFSSIRLKNFKAYKDTGDVPFAPLTIIVGANNSGKSSLLQGALVLAQSLDESSNRVLVTSGPLVQLNGFFDILHRNGSAQKTFEISLTMNPEVAEYVREYVYVAREKEILGNRLSVSFHLDSRTKEIGVKKSVLWAGEKRLIEINSEGKGTTDLFELKNTDTLRYRIVNFLPRCGWSVSPKEKASREVVLRHFGTSVSLSNAAWRFALGHVFRAGPLRLRVPWYSGVGATNTSELGLGGENLIAELGSHEPIKREGQTLVDEVNSWLSGKLGMPERVRVKGIDRSGAVRSLFCDEKQGAKNINAAAMGEGVSQVLPIISRAFSGSPVECLFVEQPEIHLHPALQADLADLFIDVVQRDMAQVVLETHSEHLLLRVRRRIAEGKISPKMVTILYVERAGSESTVRPLNLNEHGHFSDWPSGFFDEAYQEAMALAMASSTKGK